MTVAEVRRYGVDMLRRAGFSAPGRECSYLMSGVLQLPPLELELAPDREIPAEKVKRLLSFFERRSHREPAQYILGTAPFRNLELEVNPAVLIPRPETEELADLLLEKAPPDGTLLDMGTGSGAIAIALKTERPALRVTAVDVSPAALETAERNARRSGAEIEFLLSDLWEALPGRRFDLVAANLPYVSEEEYRLCDREIFFEPQTALTAPDGGTGLMKRMIRELRGHLTSRGRAVFELGDRQNAEICDFARRTGLSARARKDMAGKARFVVLDV